MADTEKWQVQQFRTQSCDKQEQSKIVLCNICRSQNEVEVEPLGHIIESQGSLPLNKKVKYGEYLRQSMQMKLDGKAHTKMAKTEN